MRIRRTFPIALVVVSLAAAITFVVQLRKHAPPEPARLLPGADAFVYANFSWVRRVSSNPLPAVSHDPEYEKFIQETGFEFERDLETVAFAVHYPVKWPGGGTGGNAPEPRFSEVFVGKFDSAKLAGYLRHTAQSVENYNSVDIFSIPIQGRTFRVAMLSVDAVAASNHDDPAVIRGIVDRSRKLASPFGGPALLRRYYKNVQLASPVWAVVHVDPGSPEFGGWNDFMSKPADVVISASYNPLHLPLRTGALHLRAEAWAGDAESARAITDKLTVYLSMFHSAESSVGSSASDADLKALFDSLQVRQEGNRAVLYALVPTGVFKKMLEAPTPTSD
ncbi:MAG TPA: hypothetical protein VMH04_14890 [Candidatus Solibacter sp.]|nr:hypothetical protein [Candidatus Solibacter sp.]